MGVLPETLKFGLDWLKKFLKDECGTEDQKWLEEVRKNPIERFNQGDEYIAKHLGLDNNIRTEIQSKNVKKPLIIDIIENM